MTEPQLRHQTRLWLTAISADLRREIQQEVERLRTSTEERIAELEGVVSASDTQLDQLAVNVVGLAEEMTQGAVAQARHEMEAAAQAELTTVRDRLQAEIETIQTEFETARIALEAQLAEAEHDIRAIRQKRDELASSLNQTRERVAALEKAIGQANLRRELAEARLKEEVQRRVAVEKQLETSRQELVLAKAEAESSRLEAAVKNEIEAEHPPSALGPQPQVPDGESAVLPADAQQFAVSRRARRVKIHAASEVLVDGVASVLVDISTHGAQVLSPTTLRPSRVVRLMFPTESGASAGEGRIVWAQLESSSPQVGAQYRAGVQFTNMDLTAINALVTRQGVPQVATPSSSYR